MKIEEALTTTNDTAGLKENERFLRGLYFQMFFLGIASVLFWSVFLIQLPFLKVFFGGNDIFFYAPFAYGLCSNIGRIIVLVWHSRSSSSTDSKLKQLIFPGAFGTCLGLILLAVLILINREDHESIGFWGCLSVTCFVGFFNSLSVTGGFSLMAITPVGTGQFFLLGLTVTGIITWPLMILLRLLVERIWGNHVTMIVSVVSLMGSAMLCLSSAFVYKRFTSRNPILDKQLKDLNTDSDGRSLLRISRAIWIPGMCLWASRVVTFALYPGLIGIFSPSSDAYSTSHYQSFLIYLGPVSDTVGQLAFRFTRLKDEIGLRSLVWMTTLRSITLIPLFLLSAYYNNTNWFIAQDWFRVILMLGFSFSMGINYSAGSSIAPCMVPSTSDRYTVGIILSFLATNGFFVGSLIGIGFKHIYE